MKKRQALTSLIIFVMCLVLTGCANLSYTGQDYDASKTSSVQTPEGFYFSTYKKTSQDGLELSIGITKTTIEAAMIVLVVAENKGQDKYYMRQADFMFKDGYGRKISVIPASSYINAYQSDQTGAYAGMQSLAPTFNKFAEISNNFQPIDNTNEVTRAQNQQSSLGRQITQATEGIAKKAMNSSEMIGQGERKSFYLFIERPNDFPITLTYKDLSFTFGSNTKDRARVFND